jgi:hypothetical protein
MVWLATTDSLIVDNESEKLETAAAKTLVFRGVRARTSTPTIK